METKTVTLTEFLLARIGEDEERADEFHEGFPQQCESTWQTPFPCTCDHPARIRAECGAKRRIVERCTTALRWDRNPDGAPAERVADFAWSTLEDLALPYADHESFATAWTSS